MLPRVLEPEVMDTPEEARDYDAMDHTEVNARFVADFLAAHGPCQGGRILDVGTGTARIPIELCRRDPAARVVASDLADQMLALAVRNVEAAGLAGRIKVRRADAKLGGAADQGRYEAVISNSIVHHIPEPADVLGAMLAAVAPGGTVFVRDLARPASVADLGRLVETYAAGESEHARALFAASLHAALTVAEVDRLLLELGVRRPDVRMTSDRHWTWTWKAPVSE
jgi:2-polyprenyl-3-methyl-5-hydroxy-6-metoxy-1,4-benzoquinol methylase